jgi:hypothetical protein
MTRRRKQPFSPLHTERQRPTVPLGSMTPFRGLWRLMGAELLDLKPSERRSIAGQRCSASRCNGNRKSGRAPSVF